MDITRRGTLPRRPERSLRTRMRWLMRGTVVGALLFVVAFLSKSALFPGVNPTADQMKQSAVNDAYRQTVQEGDIVDRAGNQITGGSKPGEPGLCLYGEEYAYLVGYRSELYGAFGVRERYDSYLYGITDYQRKGCTVQLTTDNGLQRLAYRLLDGEGSAIVLDNETGKILALASRSSVPFDINRLSESMQAAVQQEGALLRRGTYEADPPGSTMKIVTACAALEKEGITGPKDPFFDYEDTGVYQPPDNEGVIKNFAGEAFGALSLERAFVHSSNTYFAALGYHVGATQLTKTASQFLIGQEIELDFTTLCSSFDLSDYDPFLIAQTGFGQGKTQISPLHLAMIAQAIANNGEMIKPYLVQEISLSQRSLYQGKRDVLAHPIGVDTAQAVRTIMHAAAEHYGFMEEKYGFIGAKSGTAELADGTCHTYLLAFSDRYTIALSQNHGISSSALYRPMRILLDTLHKFE